MDKDQKDIEKMNQEKERQKIQQLQKKLAITRYNMEISDEIISETPSDAQQEKLIQKNKRRKHGIAGIQKEIRDMEQEMQK